MVENKSERFAQFVGGRVVWYQLQSEPNRKPEKERIAK